MSDKNRPIVGIIGVGKLGLSLARILLSKGYGVIGASLEHNAEFERLGARYVEDATAIATQSDIAIECVGSESAASHLGQAYLAGAAAGKVYVSLSTFHPDFKEEQSRLLDAGGAAYVDATISGGPARLEAGEATLFVGCDDKTVVDRCAPLFSDMTNRWYYTGEVGSASKLKLVNNALGFVHNVAVAEALALAEKMKLDPLRVIEFLAGGTGSSTALTVRGPLMARRDYGPPSGDMAGAVVVLDVMLEMAQKHDAHMTLLEQAGKFYRRALDEGRHGQDIAQVYEMINPR
ncbi:NAD(P)-binding domain-containing protein [Paraburkholderia phymatum]|uniref:NAD(P)-dependent oxidoreductase n=1 Tax=Paraburkholderia phymatum TaxID=148447 RepID=UPI0031795C04